MKTTEENGVSNTQNMGGCVSHVILHVDFIHNPNRVRCITPISLPVDKEINQNFEKTAV